MLLILIRKKYRIYTSVHIYIHISYDSVHIYTAAFLWNKTNTQSTNSYFRYNKHNLPQSNVNRADIEHHVPLCSITDVQLRFLVPDDLTEVYIIKSIIYETSVYY